MIEKQTTGKIEPIENALNLVSLLFFPIMYIGVFYPTENRILAYTSI